MNKQQLIYIYIYRDAYIYIYLYIYIYICVPMLVAKGKKPMAPYSRRPTTRPQTKTALQHASSVPCCNVLIVRAPNHIMILGSHANLKVDSASQMPMIAKGPKTLGTSGAAVFFLTEALGAPEESQILELDLEVLSLRSPFT